MGLVMKVGLGYKKGGPLQGGEGDVARHRASYENKYCAGEEAGVKCKLAADDVGRETPYAGANKEADLRGQRDSGDLRSRTAVLPLHSGVGN